MTRNKQMRQGGYERKGEEAELTRGKQGDLESETMGNPQKKGEDPRATESKKLRQNLLFV